MTEFEYHQEVLSKWYLVALVALFFVGIYLGFWLNKKCKLKLRLIISAIISTFLFTFILFKGSISHFYGYELIILGNLLLFFGFSFVFGFVFGPYRKKPIEWTK